MTGFRGTTNVPAHFLVNVSVDKPLFTVKVDRALIFIGAEVGHEIPMFRVIVIVCIRETVSLNLLLLAIILRRRASRGSINRRDTYDDLDVRIMHERSARLQRNRKVDRGPLRLVRHLASPMRNRNLTMHLSIRPAFRITSFVFLDNLPFEIRPQRHERMFPNVTLPWPTCGEVSCFFFTRSKGLRIGNVLQKHASTPCFSSLLISAGKDKTSQSRIN